MVTKSRLHRDVKKMRHNTRGNSDSMKGLLRSNERNEDSKGQSSLLCLQVEALAVQGTTVDKAGSAERRRDEGPDSSLSYTSFACVIPPVTSVHKAGSKGAASPLNELWRSTSPLLGGSQTCDYINAPQGLRTLWEGCKS